MNLRDKKIFYYDNIFWKDDNFLLKIVANDKTFWERIKDKPLDFINKPVSIESIYSYQKKKYMRDCAIIIPFLKDYVSLYDYDVPNDITTKDGLLIIKDILLKLKSIHEMDLAHGDLLPSNIMINKDRNINFIDFENGSVDGIVSSFYMYNNLYDSSTEALHIMKKEDIHHILYLLIKYLQSNKFDCRGGYLDLAPKSLNLPKDIQDCLNYYLNDIDNISEDYYFLDILKELIDSNYQSPLIEKTRSLCK